MMQWFKHDSSASQDVKIKKLKQKHGLMGYGLYWYIIERIQAGLSITNTSLSLEDDAEVIAIDWGVDEQDIQNVIDTMIALKLFSLNQQGQLFCPSIAKRLDTSMASNPKMRELITALKNEHGGNIKQSHDGVMTASCKNRIDKNKTDKTILDEREESVRGESEQADINQIYEPPQEKEVNQVGAFSELLDTSNRDIKEPMTEDWEPSNHTLVKIEESGVPTGFMEEMVTGFKKYHLNSGKWSDSWQTIFYDGLLKNWDTHKKQWKDH